MWDLHDSDYFFVLSLMNRKIREEGRSISLFANESNVVMAESQNCRKCCRKSPVIEAARTTDNYRVSSGRRRFERGTNFPITELLSSFERFVAPNCRLRINLKLLLLLVLVFFNELVEVRAKIFSTQLGPSIVETQYGKLRGMLVTLSNKNLDQVEAYLGLQYAATLGSEMRFMPPSTTTEKWENIRPALQHRPVCPQVVPSLAQLRAMMPTERVEHFRRILPFLEKQSEECLYLNVYVPVRGWSLWLSTKQHFWGFY